jgi:hypothetical protein
VQVAQPDDTGSIPRERLWDAPTGLAFAAGVAWAIYFLLAAKGVEGADPIAHFVISREAWHRPALMLHHWGRPVSTLVYMPAALFGLEAARITSLLLGVLTAFVTVRLAHRLRVQPAFAVLILFWFQPWNARWLVHPTLTEIPFTLLMVSSAYLFVSGRPVLTALIVGLLPLARIEAIALTGLWVIYCIWRREWRGAVLAMLPVVVYSGLYRWVFGQLPGGDFPIVPMFSRGARHLLARPGTLHQDWWRFVTTLQSGVGLPAVVLTLFGMPLIIRSAPRVAIFIWYAVYLAVHAAAFGVGILAAQGGDQIRYLFPIAPAVSIAGALGLTAFTGQMGESLAELFARRDHAARLGSLVMAACIVLVLAAGLRQKPTPVDPEFVAAKTTVDWLRRQEMATGPLVSTHVVIHYLLPGHLFSVRLGVDPEALWQDPPPLATMPVGTVVVWDAHFSEGFGLHYASLRSDPVRWRLLKTFEWDEGHLAVFRKESL